MTEWILTSCILILAVISLRFLFRGRVSLRLQYALWGIVLVRLLVPVSFGSSAASAANIPAAVAGQPAVQAVVDAVQPQPMDYEQAYHQVVEKHEAQGTDVSRLPESDLAQLQQEAQALVEQKSLWMILWENLTVIWALGMAAVGCVFVWTNLRFFLILKKTRRLLEVEGAKLRIYVSDAIDTPCLFGIGRPAIYVTEEVAKDATLLRHSIAHETTHFSHGDHIWSLLRGACLAVHWYNPLVWWAAFLSQRDGELACDEGTIRRLGEAERAAYGRTLIGMTCRKRTNVLSTATTMTASEGGIKERILLIVRRPKMAVYTLIAVLLIAAVAVGCTFTGAMKKEEVTGESIFPEGDVTGITVHYQGKTEIPVGTQDLEEMLAWAQSFSYGEPAEGETVEQNNGTLTLHYADGSSITSGIDAAEVDGVLYQVFRSEFPACWSRLAGIAQEETPPAPTLPPEVQQPTWPDTPPTQPSQPEEETAPPAESVPTGPIDIPVAEIDAPGIGTLYTQADPNRICIAVQLTGVSRSGDHLFYIIPEDQEAFFEAYNQAVGKLSSTEREWPETAGWTVCYKDTRWYAYMDGTLSTWSGTYTDSAAAAALYDLCLQAVRDTGIEDPVRPGDLTGIRRITLNWNGTHTVTDWQTLKLIEGWLVNSTSLGVGGAGCPFTALMTAELQNGETKTIAMATDDCGSWMSQGLYFRYDLNYEGNRLFYSLFGASVIHEAVQSGDIDRVLSLSRYLDWSRYAASYGQNAAFELIDMMKNWVEEDPDLIRIHSFISQIQGLEGQYRQRFGSYLTEIYQLNPKDFAWAIMGNAGPESRASILALLAEVWNMTTNEVSTKLNSHLNN